jgi:hypothetical protein
VEVETRKPKFSCPPERSTLNQVATTDSEKEGDSDEDFESADEEKHCYQVTAADQASTIGEHKCYYCGKKGTTKGSAESGFGTRGSHDGRENKDRASDYQYVAG